MSNEPTTPRESGEGPEDGEVDVMRFVLVAWRYRIVIIVATLLCGLAVFVRQVTTPRSYEATVKLIVAAPKTGAANEIAPTVSMASFRALVENQTIAAKVIGEFGLNRPPHEVTPSTFISRLVSIETVRDSNIIVIRVRLWDPDLAAKVANGVALAAEELAQQLSQQETVAARDVIKTQLDESRQRLELAQISLETFRQKAQIELLRKDVDALLGQRGALLALLVEIQTERARLAQAEAQLAKRDRIDTLNRSIDTDPAAMEAARKGASETGSVLPLQLRNQEVNKVYESLDEAVATSRTKLAGLEQQRSEIVDVRKLDRDQQAKLTQLYQYEMQLSKLQTEYDLAKTVYVDVATRYEQARLQVAGRSAQIQTLDAALPPDRPTSRGVLSKSALAATGGFILAIIGALFFDRTRKALAQESVTRD